MSRLIIVLWTYAPKHQVVQNILWVVYLPILNWWCNVTTVTSIKFAKFSTVHIVSSAWAPSWTFLIVTPDELQHGDLSWGNLPSVDLSLDFVTPMSEGRDMLGLLTYPGARYYPGYGHGVHVQSISLSAPLLSGLKIRNHVSIFIWPMLMSFGQDIRVL